MTEIGDYFVNKCLAATANHDPWSYTQITDILPMDSFNKLKKSCNNLDMEKIIKLQDKDSNKEVFTDDDFPAFKVFNDKNSSWRRKHLPIDDPKAFTKPFTGEDGGKFGRYVQRLYSTRPHGFPTYLYPEQWKEYNIDFEDEIRSIGKAVLKNARQLCNKFPKYRWYKDLSLNVHIKLDPPKPFEYYVHVDNPNKIWTSVIYITPEENIGTKLYTGETEDTFVKELPWKPNNLFVFCSDASKSFHSYANPSATNRITLCMFLGQFGKNTGFFYNC